MIADLKPYADYKDSNVSWLGQVPAHWSVCRIKSILQELDHRTLDGQGTLLSLTRARGLISRTSRTDKAHSAETLIGYKSYRSGEIVMNRMQAWSGMFGSGQLSGLVSPDYAVFKIIGDHEAALILERLKAPDLVARYFIESTGIGTGFNRLYTNQFNAISITLPPSQEQETIVRFLGWANNRLERSIRAKRKVIALLNEQKQVVINRTVTNGLDASAELKDTGIPWLGDIPKHWDALQVRRIASFVTSGSRGWANYYSDSGLIFLQSGNLGRSMSLNLSHIQHVRPPAGAEGERTRVRRNDVLICVTGAMTGNVAIVDQDLPVAAFVNQHVALVRIKRRMVEPRFLAYVLHSDIGRTQFKTNEYGGTKQGLSLGDVKSVFIPLPPFPQQGAICAHLDVEVARFKELTSRIEREIDLLREYRTRLISDVVTGKLDVREAALHLPDDITRDAEPAVGDLDNDDLDDSELTDEATEA